MSEILNVEIKAKSESIEANHKVLISLGASYKGVDHQVDTYFNCPEGRLKLREGNIENSFIFYKREDKAGPKQSEITMCSFSENPEFKNVLIKAYGEKVVVDKKRHIYFIDNVKFHLDELATLGSFVEIEAIDSDGSVGREVLMNQCFKYLDILGIKES